MSPSIPHPFSWLLEPDTMGASAQKVRIAGEREMTAVGADEPVPLAICDNGHRCHKREHF